MKIRLLVSMGGNNVTYVGNEKDKKGSFVFHDFDDLEAIRLVEADMAVPADEKEFEKIQSQKKKLEDEKQAKKELAENIENLEALKVSRDDLKSQLEEIEASINSAEAALKK